MYTLLDIISSADLPKSTENTAYSLFFQTLLELKSNKLDRTTE